MKSLIKLSKEQIITAVSKDLLTRDSNNIENLKKFYFKEYGLAESLKSFILTNMVLRKVLKVLF